jgi:hypothetical protein
MCCRPKHIVFLNPDTTPLSSYLVHIAVNLRPLINSSLIASGISCLYKLKSRPCRSITLVYPAARSPARSLFRGGPLVGVETVLELLAVLVARVVGKHFAACGALEGLEASFALDCLRGGVLGIALATRRATVALRRRARKRMNLRLSVDSLPPWDLSRPCDPASAVLYRELERVLLSKFCGKNGVLGSVTHFVVC